MKRQLLIAGFLLFSVSAATVTALSGTSVEDFDTLQNTEWFKAYVYGVGKGFSYANVDLRHQRRMPLYCQPRPLTLTPEQYMDSAERDSAITSNGIPRPREHRSITA